MASVNKFYSICLVVLLIVVKTYFFLEKSPVELLLLYQSIGFVVTKGGLSFEDDAKALNSYDLRHFLNAGSTLLVR
jgi:hypothetical protein